MHADLVFQACISFLTCFRTPVAPIRKILVHTGMLPCLVPSCLKLCKFVSRSDLVLISFWMLSNPWFFFSYLVCRRTSRFAVPQTKVAHLCFCLVCKRNAGPHRPILHTCVVRRFLVVFVIFVETVGLQNKNQKNAHFWQRGSQSMPRWAYTRGS